MEWFSHIRGLVLILLCPALVALTGCNSGSGQAPGSVSASSLSGPVVMLSEYQARGPRICTSVTKPPLEWEATVLVQCSMDSVAPAGLTLVQDVQQDMGAAMPFRSSSDAGMAEIDSKAEVYPLRGSYVSYFCRAIGDGVAAGQNCTKSVVADGAGWCWKTSFGDWRCKMQGAVTKVESGVGAPRSF